MIIPLPEWANRGIVVAGPDMSADPVSEVLETTEERVALDLHVGDAYQEAHEWLQMPTELVLRPNDCVRIRVREKITTPTTVFGQVCSKGGLSPEGLLVANQKVDPNFTGLLELAVFNAGDTSVKVREGDAFASLWIGSLETELLDAPRRTPTPTQGIEKRDLRETWRAARPYVFTGVVSTASAVAATLLLQIG
jgi:deoxycytidine triphosphate deaminase